MFIRKSEKNYNSDYIELQICETNLKTNVRDLVKVENVNFNHDSSLFINFEEYAKFIENYGTYFKNALHSNLEESSLDLYGVNYFSRDKVIKIIDEIFKNKPLDFEIILNFLNLAKEKNGFYILGI